jgi:hypothetical protein
MIFFLPWLAGVAKTIIGGITGSEIFKGANKILGSNVAKTAGSIWANNQNNANQRYMASNRIQLMAEDAKKAGIHPLAALGGGLTSPTIPIQNPFSQNTHDQALSPQQAEMERMELAFMRKKYAEMIGGKPLYVPSYNPVTGSRSMVFNPELEADGIITQSAIHALGPKKFYDNVQDLMQGLRDALNRLNKQPEPKPGMREKIQDMLWFLQNGGYW